MSVGQHQRAWRAPMPHGRSTDGHGLEQLDDATCLHLLSGRSVGRIGFSSGALPVIYPVNYLLDDRTLYMGCDEGSKARAARQGNVACLQIDHSEALEHDGWSVMATGRLGLVPDEELDTVSRRPIPSWALGTPELYITLQVELLSGRRLRRLEA